MLLFVGVIDQPVTVVRFVLAWIFHRGDGPVPLVTALSF